MNQPSQDPVFAPAVPSVDRSNTLGIAGFITSLVGFALIFWFVRFLHRRQIFLRL